jgi:hypothetical protein
MLPWFIYLLILLGKLTSPEKWNDLSPAQQQEILTETIISG